MRDLHLPGRSAVIGQHGVFNMGLQPRRHEHRFARASSRTMR